MNEALKNNILKRINKSNSLLVEKTLTWNGTLKSQTVDVPKADLNNVLIAVDNLSWGAQAQALTVTFDELLRVDDTTATAKIGTNDDITITSVAVGDAANALVVNVVVPDAASSELAASFKDNVLTVSLATTALKAADDTANTAALVTAAIDALAEFSATATGATPISAAETVNFTGGRTERWAESYNASSEAISFVSAASKHRIYGAFQYFPKGIKGRLTLTAAAEPTAATKTVVQVWET